jgi:ATP-dependent Clp endopeptidase proteolytic subunit ClpP
MRNYFWDASRGLYCPDQRLQESPDEPKKSPPARQPLPLPMVGVGEDKVDVMSRLLRDRTLLLGAQVDDEIGNLLVAQLLYLANEDRDADVKMYINSPGGSVSAGLGIFDTMNFIPCDVSTVSYGLAASMGAFLLGAGAKGKRKALPNSRIMIHQPLGGAQGAAADIEIQAKEILFLRSMLNEYIADYTGQPVDKVEEDCDRDFFMTPEEAKDYGIIDEVLGFDARKQVRIPKPARPQLELDR